MKLIFTFLLSFFALLPLMQAQQSFEAQEGMRMLDANQVMSRGLRSSLHIYLYDADKKMVDRLWSTFTRNRFGSRAKYDRHTKEFIAENARVRAIASYPVNLVTQSAQLGKDVRVSLSVDMQGAFLNSGVHPRRTLDAYTILEDFAHEVEREKVRLRVQDESRRLQKMQNEIRQLKNANIRYHREIEFAEARIKKAQENIVKNVQEQEQATERLAKQREALAAVKKMLQEL